MLSIFTLGAQRMAIDPALPRAGTNPGLTCASVLIEEIPAMAIPPRAAPVVLRKSLLLDMPTTPFGISIVESLKVLAFSRRDNTLFWRQFKSLYKRFRLRVPNRNPHRGAELFLPWCQLVGNWFVPE
jgi:hypothetical protein